MFGLKPLSSSRHSGSTIPCEFLKWTGRCCSFVDCIGMVISLLAGNCLPYHQPYPTTHNPCMCCCLPVMAHDLREEVLLACFPGGPTTDHPCSLLASPEASDEDDVYSRCPHSTILSVMPSAQQTSGWEGPLVDCLVRYPLPEGYCQGWWQCQPDRWPCSDLNAGPFFWRRGLGVQSWWWYMGGATPSRIATLTLVQL